MKRRRPRRQRVRGDPRAAAAAARCGRTRRCADLGTSPGARARLRPVSPENTRPIPRRAAVRGGARSPATHQVVESRPLPHDVAFDRSRRGRPSSSAACPGNSPVRIPVSRRAQLACAGRSHLRWTTGSSIEEFTRRTLLPPTLQRRPPRLRRERSPVRPGGRYRKAKARRSRSGADPAPGVARSIEYGPHEHCQPRRCGAGGPGDVGPVGAPRVSSRVSLPAAATCALRLGFATASQRHDHFLSSTSCRGMRWSHVRGQVPRAVRALESRNRRARGRRQPDRIELSPLLPGRRPDRDRGGGEVSAHRARTCPSSPRTGRIPLEGVREPEECYIDVWASRADHVEEQVQLDRSNTNPHVPACSVIQRSVGVRDRRALTR
jgi:hypothetical protein